MTPEECRQARINAITDREQRDRALAYFIEEFEKKHGYKPVMRRTKSGGFMFDEKGKNEIHLCGGQLAHHAFYMNR